MRMFHFPFCVCWLLAVPQPLVAVLTAPISFVKSVIRRFLSTIFVSKAPQSIMFSSSEGTLISWSLVGIHVTVYPVIVLHSMQLEWSWMYSNW